jgi:hypothetical protein
VIIGRRLTRALTLGLGPALIVAAAVLMLWPLHANGVSGNAIRPHVHDFGWYSYIALPAHPTHADFVRAGVTPPQDVVHDRRWLAAEVAGAGAILGVLSVAVMRRRRPETATAASRPTR